MNLLFVWKVRNETINNDKYVWAIRLNANVQKTINKCTEASGKSVLKINNVSVVAPM